MKTFSAVTPLRTRTHSYICNDTCAKCLQPRTPGRKGSIVAALGLIVFLALLVQGAASAQVAHGEPALVIAQTAVGATGAATVTFTFDSGGNIAAPAVLTQGATGMDFQDASSGSCTTNGSAHVYNSGDTCTVNVSFSPTVPGTRMGAVQLVSTSGTVVGEQPLAASGTGPYVIFPENHPAITVATISGTYRTAPLPMYGVTTDGAGNLYFGDPTNGGVIKAMAMNGVVGANAPQVRVGSGIGYASMLAVDGAGNLFVTDTHDNSVKEVVAVNGTVTASSQVLTIAGGYQQLTGVTVDTQGNVYFADWKQAAIYKIQAVNGVVSSQSPVTLLYSNIFYGPTALRFDASGNLYIQDTDFGSHSNVIELLAANGVISSSSNYRMIGSNLTASDLSFSAAGVLYTSAYAQPIATTVNVGGPALTDVSLFDNLDYSSDFTVTPQGQAYYSVVTSYNGTVAIKATDMRTAAPFSFAQVPPGSTATQSKYLNNAGNAALSFPVPNSGINPTLPTSFAMSGGTCPALTPGSSTATIAAGGSCKMSVLFNAPSTPGVVSGSLVYTDTHENASAPSYATQSIALIAPVGYTLQLVAQSASVTQGVGPTNLTATLSYNTSAPTGPVTFAVDGAGIGTAVCSATNSTTSTCTLSFDSKALSLGLHTFTATIAADANYAQTVSAQTNNVAVVAAAGATSQSGSVTVPATLYGSTSAPVSVKFTLAHSGTLNAPQVLTLGATHLDYKDAGTGTCTTNGSSHSYAAGDSCTVNVTFTPTAVGRRPGAVVLLSGSGTVLAQVNLAGAGIAPLAIFPAQTNLTMIAAETYAPLANSTQASVGGGMVMDGKGDLIFGNDFDGSIQMLAATNGTIPANTPFTTIYSGFTSPDGLAMDGAGNLYVADSSTGVLKEILAQNGSISSTSPAVTLTEQYNLAGGVAVDDSGNVYFTALDNSFFTAALYRMSAVNGVVQPDGAVTEIGTGLVQTFNIRTDANQNVFVSSYSGISEYPASGGSVQAGTTAVTFNDSGIQSHDVYPEPSGNLLVADRYDIYEYQGTATTKLFSPYGQADYLDANLLGNGLGQIYIAVNTGNSLLVERIDQTAPPTTSFAITAVGSTSAYQMVSLENGGNTTLSLNAPSSGTNGSLSTGFTAPAGYQCLLSSTPAGAQTVPAGSTCTADPEFAPVTGQSGNISGSLTVVNNNLNTAAATQIMPLVGTVDSGPNTIPTTTVVTVSPSTGAAGTSFSLSAVVTSSAIGAVNGTVAYYDNGTALASGSQVTVSNGVTNSFLAQLSGTGTHMITAVFTPASGSSYKSSTSAAVSVSVGTVAQATILLSNLTATYSKGVGVAPSVTTQPLGLSTKTTFSDGSSYEYNVGSYPFTVTIIDPNYTGSATGTLVIKPATVLVTLSNLSATYDGNPHGVTVTTSPTNVSTGVTYNGSATVPKAAGSYAVVATVTDSNYTGSATGTLVIGNDTQTGATVTLSNLNAIYDGTPHGVTVTTNPSGLSTSVTYNGSSIVPTAAGSYAVVATVTNANYSGSASGTLVIAKAQAMVTLNNLSATYDGNPHGVTVTTNPTGLGTSVTYNGATVVPSAVGSYAVVATVTDASYSGSASGTLVIAAVSTTGDFTFASTGSAAQSVSAPGSAAYVFQATPAASGFGSDVTFTATGLPTGASAAFSPAMLAAGSTGHAITMTVTVSPSYIAADSGSQRDGRTLFYALFLFPLLCTRGMRDRLRSMTTPAVCLVAVALAVGALSGCGSRVGSSTATGQTYSVVVTAASGSVQHNATVQLNIALSK